MYQDPNGARFRRSRIGLGGEWEGKKETENGRDEKLHKPERVADSVVPVNPILPSLVDKRSYSVPALRGRTDRSTSAGNKSNEQSEEEAFRRSFNPNPPTETHELKINPNLALALDSLHRG